VSDAAGNSVVVETANYNASAVFPDATRLVSNPVVRALLPTWDWVQQHSVPDYAHGAFARWHNYSLPPEFLDYNPVLFKLANVSYDPQVWCCWTHWRHGPRVLLVPGQCVQCLPRSCSGCYCVCTMCCACSVCICVFVCCVCVCVCVLCLCLVLWCMRSWR
jgi:hypothetical protein